LARELGVKRSLLYRWKDQLKANGESAFSGSGRPKIDQLSEVSRLKKEMKLTQDDFAGKLKIHSKQLAKYEAGRSTPSIDIIARIAKFCEVSTDYLIFGADKILANKTKIADLELLDYFQRVNKLKKSNRDKIKWAVKSLLNGDA